MFGGSGREFLASETRKPQNTGRTLSLLGRRFGPWWPMLLFAVVCIVVATWQTRAQVVFEVICAERMRTPLCGLLAGVLSRPFHTAGTWLLSQHEAVALIDLSAHANT